MSTAPSSAGGRFDFDDGGSYAGGWRDGMSHGHGVCTGPRAHGEYAGAWQQGFETSGVYTWTSGSFYEGQWLQGRRHGLGVEKKGAWLYRGEWTQGYKGRYGTRQSTLSGAMFEGTWTSGMQDGYGVETYADGGTYQGQWLRGVRHGYGVRQSVSYDLAVRYRPSTSSVSPTQPLPASTLTLPGSEKEMEGVLRERDRRLEESRGGFVLHAGTAPPLEGAGGAEGGARHQRLLLDKYGKPSLRKTIVKELKLIRQKSAGDLHQDNTRSASRQSGGSVRSTASSTSQSSGGSGATSVSVYSSLAGGEGAEEGASFSSQPDLSLQDNVVERYLGEWKGDRRAGYGVCDRSDGVRYEGEWLNNKKYGYGVTTLRDGSRVEGKYKNNVLVSSGKNSRLFVLRSSKLRDRVEAAVGAAHRAADIAKQKAEIAYARMSSARVKSDQAQESARTAAADAALARATARQYAPDSSRPGSKIIANRLQEEELLADFAEEGSDLLSPLRSPLTPPTSAGGRFSSLFRSSKKIPATDGRGYEGGAAQFEPQVNAQNRATLNFSSPSQANYVAGGRGYGSNPSGFSQPNNDPFHRSQAYNPSDQSQFRSGSTPGQFNQWQDGRGGGFDNRSDSREFSNNPRWDQQSDWSESVQGRSDWPESGQVRSEWPEPNQARSDWPQSGQHRSEWSESGQGYSNWSNLPADKDYGGHQRPYAAGGGTANYPNGGFRGDAARNAAQTGYNAAVQPGCDSDYRSYDDAYSVSEYGRGLSRRKTMPSIVKEKIAAVTTTGSATTTTTTTSTTSSTAGGIRQQAIDSIKAQQGGPGGVGGVGGAGAPEVRRRQHIDTFVIEDGVRKRVRSVHDPQGAAGSIAASSTGVAGAGQWSMSPGRAGGALGGEGEDEGEVRLPREYMLESPRMYRKQEMGSVPDIATAAKQNIEVLPREVVYQLSQHRREERMRERAEEEARRRNQIVLRLGDLKDWCERRQVLMLVLAVNVSLATVFFNLLY